MSKQLTQTQLPYDQRERDAQNRKSLRCHCNNEIERLVIPEPPAGSKTKASTCKQVLSVLNEKIGTYEACRMFLGTIMETTGVRQRATIVSALAYLKVLGLVEWRAGMPRRHEWEAIRESCSPR